MSGQNLDYASILSNSGRKVDIPKPSIFDILAQENMNSLFRLSFNHCLKWLSKHFTILQKSQKLTDEIYLFLHSSIELLYLKVYDSLFSEHFYGLKRDRLSNIKRVLSVLFSIVLPYIKAKLDHLYENLEKNLDEQPQSNSAINSSKLSHIKKKFENILLKFYPYFHILWSSFFWVYRFRYMVNLSEVHSPFLSILGVKLVYDMSVKNQKPNSILKKILLFFNNTMTNILYFIQFLKWYQDYQENQSFSNEFNVFTAPFKNLNDHNSAQEDELLPPPILPEKIAQKNFFKNQTYHDLCPICTKKRSNECVLSVSGFVFCYPCIFKFIKAHNRCPITSYPCTTKDLIRIFTS